MLTRLVTLPARMTWAAVSAAVSVVLDDVFGEAEPSDGYVSTTSPAMPPPFDCEGDAFDADAWEACRVEVVYGPDVDGTFPARALGFLGREWCQ